MNDSELDELGRSVGAALGAAGWMLATAESCTGGWVAQVVTSIAGSSGWFDRGFVTYSNEAKREMLRVPEATLAAHGAVSEPTARAMAEGAIAASRADIAVAITGVAGPGGGSPEKPVGTVAFAWCRRGEPAHARTVHLAGDRREIRRQSVILALTGVVDRAVLGKENPQQ